MLNLYNLNFNLKLFVLVILLFIQRYKGMPDAINHQILFYHYIILFRHAKSDHAADQPKIMLQTLNRVRAYFSRYSVGVLPFRRLKARLKFDTLLKPDL